VSLCPNFGFIHCARSTIEEVSFQLMPNVAKNLSEYFSVISKFLNDDCVLMTPFMKRKGTDVCIQFNFYIR
jgi:hypothetical protein